MPSDGVIALYVVLGLSGGITALAFLINSVETKGRYRIYSTELNRYRRQLLQAAIDLDQHLVNICDHDLGIAAGTTTEKRKVEQEVLSVYTSYLIAQFLGWIWIVEGFAVKHLGVVPDFCITLPPREHSALLEVQEAFNSAKYGKEERHFAIWTVEQRGIGQMVTWQEEKLHRNDNSLRSCHCMGYMPFRQHWRNGGTSDDSETDSEPIFKGTTEPASSTTMPPLNVTDRVFRAAFISIEEGVATLSGERYVVRDTGRIRRVQHALAKLINTMQTIPILPPTGANHSKTQ